MTPLKSLAICCLLTACSSPSYQLMHYAPLNGVQPQELLRTAATMENPGGLEGVQAGRPKRGGGNLFLVRKEPASNTMVHCQHGYLVLWTGWMNKAPAEDALEATRELQAGVYAGLAEKLPGLPPVAALQRADLDYAKADEESLRAWRALPPWGQGGKTGQK